MSDTTVNENDLGERIEEEEVVLTDEDREIEGQARRMGWRPKEEFDRPPARWVDAKTFVERGLAELPIVRERYRKLDSQMANTVVELTATKSKVEEQSSIIHEMREMLKSAEDRAYVRAARELAERERAAVEAADTAAYDRVQQERRDLEVTRRPPPVTTPAPPVAAAPPAATPAPPAPDPVIEQWVAENPWFTTDPVLNSVAIAIDAQVKREHPEWTVSEQLAEAKRQVVARFPEKFENSRRAAPPAVMTSNNSPPRQRKKGIKDLPKEFQDAFARFKRQMPDYTEEEYLKTLGEM